MIQNYLRTTLRHMLRNKAFSLINVVGLSIGISAALVIFLIARYDFSFDRNHKEGDRIYRVVSIFNFSGQEYKNSGVQFPLTHALRRESTGLSMIVPISLWSENQKLEVPANGKNTRKVFKKPKPVFVDDSYFRMIDYRWIAGNAAVSLQSPYNVVLTEKAASLYYPGMALADVVGQSLVFDDSVKTTVTGIVKNLEGQTDFNFQVFVSRITQEKTTLKPDTWDSWNNTNGNGQLFVQLSPGTKPEQVQQQVQALLNAHDTKEAGDKTTHTVWLQPLSDLHFNAEFGNFEQRTAHKPTLYGLIAVAVFLLLLGCINFINLTTAQASDRAREIGIRKTMGSSRKQLVFLFLGETFLLTLVATLLSLCLAPVLLEMFSDFIPPELHFNLVKQPILLLFLAGLVLLLTVLSGFYPAWILSAFKPVNALKNQSAFTPGLSRSAWVRKSLTVSQFVIAQFFILATMIVGQQIRYSLNKQLGFQKEAIVYFDVNWRDTVRTHKPLLEEKLKAIPEVAAVGLSTGTPSHPNSWSSTITYRTEKGETSSDVEMKFADSNYTKQFGLKLLAGSNLETSDSITQFLVNETYTRLLGFRNPQEALGKYLTWSNRQVPITGVIADFHYQSMREKIRPFALGSWKPIERVFSVTLQPRNADGSNWKAALAKMEQTWKSIYPEEDFNYQFLDAYIAGFYRTEQHIASLLAWATGLAIFISCLGLLGLVTYTTRLRTKEIGVRKVLGASVSHIVSLLSRDFLILVLIAFVIAAPLAWMAMQNWIAQFAYRTSISLWWFGAAGLLSVLAALLTVGYQTFKAAAAKPVKSLRSE